MKNLNIYKASAGSGKTFLLTLSFLKIAIEAPMNFSKILAVTFTNKAAEEMKSRIIEELNNIITKKQDADFFFDLKNHLNNISDNELISRAEDIRNKILHNYSMLYVSTIDSFVQKVIKSFTFEMNLNSNYGIELDQAAVNKELSNMLFMEISENKDLQKWLIKFASHKIDQNKSWDFRVEISTLAQELFKERFQDLEQFQNITEESKSLINNNLSTLLNELYAIINNFENEFEKIADKVKTILNEKNIDRELVGNIFKIISNYFFVKIPQKKYDPYDTQTLSKALNGIENWHKKNESKDIINKIESIFEDMYKCLEDAFNLYDKGFEKYISAKKIIADYYAFGILKDLALLLPKYRNDNNVLLISDTTVLLKKIIGNNDAPFIYEKIGSKFQNILIDEFQDTSAFQWANFKPLIENSLAESNFNLIVGDIKQSIYRWRGGDWKLLLSGVKNEINNELIIDKNLDTNWRSQKNIIDFNNSLFKIAPQILQRMYNQDISELKNDTLRKELIAQGFDKVLTDAYSENFQKTPQKPNKIGGKVNIEFIKHKTNDEYSAEISQKLPETVYKLISENNYKPGDIAILCRKNNEVKDVVKFLLTAQELNPDLPKFEILSSDSLSIDSSWAVQIIIAALKYLIKPEDQIQINLLKLVYFRKKTGNLEIVRDLFTTDEKEILPQIFFESISNLKRKSIYEICEELINIFELNTDIKDFPYIKALQDYINDFAQKKGNDIISFLETWDESGHNKSIQMSEEQDAVKVMTLHKSKGLAFKAVILPYANWSIDNSNNRPLLWVQTKDEPFKKFKYLPVQYGKELLKSVFIKDYLDEKLNSYMDALNMMYVAFTRAEHDMYIFAPIKFNSAGSLNLDTIGSLLYQAVQESDQEITENENKYIALKKYICENPYNVVIDHNYKNISYNIDEKNKNINNKISLTNYPGFDWSKKLDLHTDSDEFYIESIKSVEEKVNYGNLMHKIFAEINSTEETEKAVETIFKQGFLTFDEKIELTEKINKIISRPIVSQWFKPGLKVYNEEGIISIDGELKIPDRVIIDEQKITVIDFKFGKVNNDYIKQVSEYKELLKSIFNKEIQGIIYYAETDKIVYV